MGKSKNPSDFDKGQIMMTRRLDQSISKTCLEGCSWYAVDSTNQKWSKEGQPETGSSWVLKAHQLS